MSNYVFKNLPFTYRGGLILDSIEELRRLTQDKYGSFFILLSSNLYRQLEMEMINRVIYFSFLNQTGFLIRAGKLYVMEDIDNLLPSNSIINIDRDVRIEMLTYYD